MTGGAVGGCGSSDPMEGSDCIVSMTSAHAVGEGGPGATAGGAGCGKGPALAGGGKEPRSCTPRGQGGPGGSSATAPGMTSPISTVATEAALLSVSESGTGQSRPPRR